MDNPRSARPTVLTRVRPVLISSLLFATSQLPAQQAPPAKPEQAPAPATTTLSVDARLVNIPVVVRDKKGALVQNLTKNDFTLSVDNHPGTIRYFDLDANLPLTLGLLVDTSGSVRNVLDEERSASSAFLDTMLTAPANRDPDKAFIIQFAYQVELLQDTTSSRPKLQAALRDIDSTGSYRNSQPDPNDPNDPGNNGGGRRGPRGGGGGTALYDAAFLAADELMSKQKGRKALILLTDGVDNGSKESLTKAIEAAQRADTIIYAIYFKGEQGGGGNPGNRGGGNPGGRGGGYPGGGGGRFPGGGGGYPGGGGGGGYPGGGGGGYPGGGGGGGQRGPGGPGGGQHADGKKTLERMATETGGRMFEVTKKETFDQIYTQIAAELRGMYRLGYTPDPATASDGYHQIDLAFKEADKQKNLKIQTRDGYYTGK